MPTPNPFELGGGNDSDPESDAKWEHVFGLFDEIIDNFPDKQEEVIELLSTERTVEEKTEDVTSFYLDLLHDNNAPRPTTETKYDTEYPGFDVLLPLKRRLGFSITGQYIEYGE